MNPFRVICIRDTERPESIPTSKWVKKNEYYTVIMVTKMLIQGGKIGFKLKELDIDDCFPYTRFSAERFGIPVADLWAEEYLAKMLEEAKEEYLVEHPEQQTKQSVLIDRTCNH